jgi:hypothetical protein
VGNTKKYMYFKDSVGLETTMDVVSIKLVAISR